VDEVDHEERKMVMQANIPLPCILGKIRRLGGSPGWIIAAKKANENNSGGLGWIILQPI
jgi:hypothetical protein